MVKILSKEDHEAIKQAVAQCESKTSAELVVVVAPASDAYQSYILLYGLGLGSIIASGLWLSHTVMDFPSLFSIQIAGMVLLSMVPPLRALCLHLIPKRIRHHRAARRAYEEYLIVTRHLPATTPVVLFYISLAERYAHILPCRMVRDKIATVNWEAVIAKFTYSVKPNGLRAACIHAVEHCSEILAPAFPGTGKSGKHIPDVIEIQ